MTENLNFFVILLTAAVLQEATSYDDISKVK